MSISEELQQSFRNHASILQGQIRELIQIWIPGGRFEGNEYVAASKAGGKGNSFKYNVIKCTGSDFATKETYGDPLDLYAKIHGISNYDALKATGGSNGSPGAPKQIAPPVQKPKPEPRILLSTDTVLPTVFTRGATCVHEYFNEIGERVGYVLRFDNKENGKRFLQYSWDGRAWDKKAMAEPRPLYNLHELAKNPGKQVLLVEGEKCADAAKRLRGEVSIAVTWPGGSQAYRKVDWKPLFGRDIILWPDNDDAGFSAMHAIGETLLPHCPNIRVIDPSGQEPKWDIANAEEQGLTGKKLSDWMKANIKPFNNPEPELEPEVLDMLADPNEYYPQELGTYEENGSEELQRQRTYGQQVWYGAKVIVIKNKPMLNLDNLVKMFAYDEFLKNLIWYDEFYMEFMTNWNSDKPRRWEEGRDDGELLIYLQNKIGLLKLTKELAREAAEAHAYRNSKNVVVDWMRTLEWDNEPRLDKFLERAMGAEGNEYTRAVSKNFWIAMVARTYNPGCKFDHMVVLEGKQGIKKSSALRAIGGEWYGETIADLENRDFAIGLKGKLILELSELASFAKASAEVLKKVLTTQNDDYRPVHGTRYKLQPRRGIIIGTTNADTYLKDATGNRRFWPILCTEIDIDYIEKNRTQLFAEAVHRFNKHEPFYEVPLEHAQEQQEQRVEGDPWEGAILSWLNREHHEVQIPSMFTADYIITEVLKIPPAFQKRGDKKRLGDCATNLGLYRHKPKIRNQDGIRRSQLYYFKSKEAYNQFKMTNQVTIESGEDETN